MPILQADAGVAQTCLCQGLAVRPGRCSLPILPVRPTLFTLFWRRRRQGRRLERSDTSTASLSVAPVRTANARLNITAKASRQIASPECLPLLAVLLLCHGGEGVSDKTSLPCSCQPPCRLCQCKKYKPEDTW